MSLHDTPPIPAGDTLTIPALACPPWCASCSDPNLDGGTGSHDSGRRFGVVGLGRTDQVRVDRAGVMTVTPGPVEVYLGADDGPVSLDYAREILADLPRALAALDG